MPIDTEHPQYTEFAKRWDKMDHVLSDEDTVKEKGETYLPRTVGMIVNNLDTAYESYKTRARFPEITIQAQTAMVGLIFEEDPVGKTDDVITNVGQTNRELARDVIRALTDKGRDILVIDAPPKSKGGGDPFIARYAAKSMINWKTDPTNPSELLLAVFREDMDADGDDIYEHETETVYRRYMRLENGKIEVSRWARVGDNDVLIEEAVELPIEFMPIVPVGSIDLIPACDPIPLLPVARCAFAYYRKSADYEDALHRSGQPTAWVSGISEDQYKAILAQGIGSSSLWYLGDSGEGQAGFLEAATLGNEHREAMAEELKQAESFAVRLTQSSDTPESGVAIAKRAAAQHASIYTIADSASLGVSLAQQMRAQWAGLAEPDEFKLDAKIKEEYAGEQMITALNNAVSSLNAPRTSLFEAIRRAGLSELTDEQMQAEIETQGGNVLRVA